NDNTLILDEPFKFLSPNLAEKASAMLSALSQKLGLQIIMVSHNANLVVTSDSEQVIVANRNGNNRPNEDNLEFNYFSGGLEYSQLKNESYSKEETLKSQGIKEHVCEILEGGEKAFEKRRKRYNL
ncbi:MAG: ABC transporter ATP-binding protein, partial [Patescibacteria group bacterium]|nr:ABC transporter ATP-binding protein [Patescibacteria group bacterium]